MIRTIDFILNRIYLYKNSYVRDKKTSCSLG